jgi:hypothetical protein
MVSKIDNLLKAYPKLREVVECSHCAACSSLHFIPGSCDSVISFHFKRPDFVGFRACTQLVLLDYVRPLYMYKALSI